MSRITKWKIEKTKVKVVFRLQFHATHISQPGWDKLFISFFPADSGKAIAKTTKANVRNGTCKWADPIYETTRLLQDIKTRQYDEKLYKLVVGMGSSRSTILGEANINLAHFVDALKPTAIALPLNGSEARTTLHVTVQLLTSKTGFREFEQQGELRERGLQTTSPQGAPYESADSNKVGAKMKFKKESKELPCISSPEGRTGVNGEYSDSTVGFDVSSTTSESTFAENHDMSNTHKVDSLQSAISADFVGLSLSQNHRPEKRDASVNQFPSQGSDLIHGWSYSSANDLVAVSEGNSRLKGNLEVVESSILDLQLEVNSLQNHAVEIGVEMQKFAEQLAAEISSGEELAKEVAVLKFDCLKFKQEFEKLKSSELSLAYAIREPTETDQNKLFQNHQLKQLKGLLLMEDKLKDIQKKVSMGFHEKDFGFLNSDLEALVKVLHDLKQESGEKIVGTTLSDKRESQKKGLPKGELFLTRAGSDPDLFQREGMVHYLGTSGLASHESDSIDPTLAIKGKCFELLRELDESQTERENLAMKMDQMECYYEALVQELEQSQRQMMAELQNLRNEHSACLYTISSSKSEMEKMHQNMNEQRIKYAGDKRILDSFNNKLENRAISAEAALKKARLNYSIAVGQLQKDLKLLSCQVLSMYETNENLKMQALSDSSFPSPDGCPETVKYPKNLEEGKACNRLLCQNKNASLNKQHLEDFKKSLHLQERLYKQIEEEVCQMHFVNIYLDVFSKALQETLLEASVDIRLMEDKIYQLSQQLQLSTESKEFMVLRLQNAMNDIHSLNEYQASFMVKNSDSAQQKEILEANLKNLSHDNHQLIQKTIELESLLIEYRSYESRYMDCSAENLELKNFLKKEILENDCLCDEISILQEDLKAVRNEFDKLASMKDNLQTVVGSFSNKLQKLLTSYENKYGKLSLCSRSKRRDLESENVEDLLLQLEELLQSACDWILLLIEGKKVLVNEKHMAQVSLNTAESDILVMKQKFEHDLQEMVSNLSVSSALLQKLQLEFEKIVNRVQAGSDAEEIYSQHHKELVSGLDHLETELRQLSSRNQDLTQEILRVATLSGELETCKLTLAVITEEKKDMEVSLQEKTEEYAKVASELNFSKERLHSLYNELHAERTFREKLEETVTDLTSELNEKQCRLQDFDSNKEELIHLKQLVAGLELEKSRISYLLWQSEERLKNALRESSISCPETHFSEFHEFSIATDVIMIFSRAQFGGRMEELIEQLHSTQMQLDVLHKINLDVESELNSFLSRESAYIEENARLLASLDMLKSELEASAAQNRVLIDHNSAIIAEIKELKCRAEEVNDASYVHDNQSALEVARLEHLLVTCNREVEGLFFSKEEVEFKCIILKAKLETAVVSLKQSDAELIRQQNHCNELTKRLSDQSLKTQEFKNLSIHLKKLKDKADAESIKNRDKRGNEGPPVAMQESLRIAFIKEQHETKLQELKHQLFLSKKHSEEMLWKLQDAIDEIENRKKSEAFQLKRNEELGMKILDLEAELQDVLSEKRNLLNAYDMVKAERECLALSLECCKQEKQDLEASLIKCIEEKSKIVVELASTQELIESSQSHLSVLKEENEAFQRMICSSDEPVEDKLQARNSISDIPTVEAEIVYKITGNNSSVNPFFNSMNHKEAKFTYAAYSHGPKSSHLLINMDPEDPLALRGLNGYQTYRTEADLQQNEQKHVALTQRWKSSMDHLNKELEKMKNENLLLPVDDHGYEPNFPGLQREVMQLLEANHELGNIFPVFNEISITGNALERVLALEIELAEALQGKKKSSIQFQSSFLKQHNDEEAIFRSFKDINELIKDMLELKARHVAVETELKEMHDRYSQLSLHFAEVEGERQKLMMTLKSTRASKKP